MLACPFFSPALICPLFLDVADIIECAVDRHIIIVTSNVERAVKFNGPLMMKNTPLVIVAVRSSFCLVYAFKTA